MFAGIVSSSSTLQSFRHARDLWWLFCPPVYLLRSFLRLQHVQGSRSTGLFADGCRMRHIAYSHSTLLCCVAGGVIECVKMIACVVTKPHVLIIAMNPTLSPSRAQKETLQPGRPAAYRARRNSKDQSRVHNVPDPPSAKVASVVCHAATMALQKPNCHCPNRCFAREKLSPNLGRQSLPLG